MRPISLKALRPCSRNRPGPSGVISLVLVCCACLSCAGWTLSALHELNAAGYSIVLLAGVLALCLWRIKSPICFQSRANLYKTRRRFRRLLPGVFLLVAGLALIGGLLHAPNNYDAMTYRLPRMLNWLADGKWTWVPTVDQRVNFATAGWEWIAMPLFLLSRSDRGLFLINILSFLLLPGLLFSVFRQSRVRRRVAWVWMWILPLAYGYVMQAGSVGNDLTGVVFALMAVHFGLRARRSNQLTDVWLAGLAAALMTASKLSNLPLLLPCLIAVWPALGKLRQRWVASAGVVGVGVLISAAPTVALNQIHTGCWNGDPHDLTRVQIKNPIAGMLGNSLLLLQQSFMPPVLPGAHRVDGWLDRHLPASWSQMLKKQFPRYRAYLNELPQEESSGLGLGITLLLLIAVGAAIGQSRSEHRSRSIGPPAWWIGLGAWVALLFFMAKMGSEADPRILLPYYPLVALPILALPGQDWLARCGRWRVLAALCGLSVGPALILTPSRPLWPAVAGSEWLAHRWPDKPSVRRLATVYSCYAHRNDLLAPLRAALPANVREVGFVAGIDDTDYSLWRPFGKRRVVYLRHGPHEKLSLPENIKWIVIKRDVWAKVSPLPLKEWAAQHQAKIVLSVPIRSTVSAGDETWCLLHLQPSRKKTGNS